MADEHEVAEVRGLANAPTACPWCFTATVRLRAATGDPTATTTCTLHREEAVGDD